MSDRFRFRLYVTAGSATAERAEHNLRLLLRELLGDDRFEVEIVDIAADVEVVEKEKILATPTVVRVAPRPERRVIGDLSHSASVIHGLGLPAR